MKTQFTLVLLISLLGCQSPAITETYYYKLLSDDSVVSYMKIDYKFLKDSIIEKQTYVNVPQMIGITQKKKYIKVRDGLDIFINGKQLMYLRLQKSSCVTHYHPLGHEVKNCYLENVEYREFGAAIKFSYSEEVMDGVGMIVYLSADDYSLLAQEEMYSHYLFDQLIRIPKEGIPDEFLEIL